MKKVIIVSPDPIYGGSLVLFKVNQLLNEEGIDSRIFISNAYRNPELPVIIFWIKWIIKTIMHTGKKVYNGKKFRRKYTPFIDKRNTIVIYPEKIYGNYMGAKNVVRYFLYYNKYSNDAYGKDDLFICYRKQFNDYNLNPDEKQLFIECFDKNIYRKYNYEKRSGKCYIIRKGKNRIDLPTEFDGPIIDELPEEEKVRIFNECEYCYSYDTQTFYTKIASYCGCIPIVVTEDGKNINNYVTLEDKRYGIAYGDSASEIEYAKRTQKDLIEEINNIEKNNIKAIRNFIKLLEQVF